jgi:restriction endonuclease S subunit
MYDFSCLRKETQKASTPLPSNNFMPTVTLTTIATIRMGVTLRGRDATRPDPEGSCLMVQIGDLRDDGTLANEDFLRIEPNEPIKPQNFLQTGDILFPNRGLRTTSAVLTHTAGNVIVGAQFFVIRCTSTQVIPEFLAWTLRTDQAARYFATLRKGTLVQTLQRRDLEDFPVPLPPLSQQQSIVELISLQREATTLEKRLAELKRIHFEESLQKSIK